MVIFHICKFLNCLIQRFFGFIFIQISQLIIDCLRYSNATDTISQINGIRQQLISLSERHGVDVNGFPQLSKEDFWYAEGIYKYWF